METKNFSWSQRVWCYDSSPVMLKSLRIGTEKMDGQKGRGVEELGLLAWEVFIGLTTVVQLGKKWSQKRLRDQWHWWDWKIDKVEMKVWKRWEDGKLWSVGGSVPFNIFQIEPFWLMSKSWCGHEGVEEKIVGWEDHRTVIQSVGKVICKDTKIAHSGNGEGKKKLPP